MEAPMTVNIAAADITRRVEVPMEYRLALVSRVDEEARTVDVVFTTGAAVKRRDYWTGDEYDEVLVVDHSAVDLKRLNSGANVLDTHQRWSLGDILGVVERAWIEKGQGLATVRFPAKGLRAAADEVLGLIRDKIIRNVSVGYATHKAEWDRTTTPATRRAVKWEPYEISFVAVGADAGAGTRHAVPVFACEIVERAGPAEEGTMENHNRTAPVVSREERIVQNERTRSQTIRTRIRRPFPRTMNRLNLRMLSISSRRPRQRRRVRRIKLISSSALGTTIPVARNVAVRSASL
jgi:hypothetical protein